MLTTPIQAIYASTSGNTEIVVEKVASIWRQNGLSVDLHRAEQTPLNVLATHQVFLLATSTWEHGQLNPFFKKIFEALKDTDCTDKKAAFIGMGDTRYEPVLFCEGMELVRRRWLEQRGQEIGTCLKINGEPYGVLDTLVTAWALEVQSLLLAPV